VTSLKTNKKNKETRFLTKKHQGKKLRKTINEKIVIKRIRIKFSIKSNEIKYLGMEL
jgi:uncharacterized protein YehS (DUF1456 family)